MKHLHLSLVAALLMPFSNMFAATAPGGSDNAGNYPGLTDYKNVNGGSCFIAGFSGAGTTFFGSSPNIDTAGRAFGLSGGSINRTFGVPGGNPAYALDVGQMFRFQLQSGVVPVGGSYNLTLNNAQSLGTTLRFVYTAGTLDYTLSITEYTGSAMFTTRTVDTGVPFSLTGVDVGFTLAGANKFNLTITPIGGATTALSDNFFGTPYAISINNSNAGNLYFNNLTVAPEPGTWIILATGGVVATCLALKRRSASRA